MSSFDRDEFLWRETYFVLFPAARRPFLAEVEQVLRSLPGVLELEQARADEQGRFESITVRAPADFAAMDISFEAGESVVEQVANLQKELKRGTVDVAKLAKLKECDARIDLMHFEQVASSNDDDDFGEMFDPASLLLVLEALVKLTGGVGVDPQSGTLV